MTSNSSSGRMFRLCQKELRESLRDRRTIITLVLMPLLVYPLLSMILQRLLLSTATNNEVQVIRIGLENLELKDPLIAAIDYGRHLLAVNGNETLSIEHPDAPSSVLSSPTTNRSAVQHLLGQNVELFPIEQDGRQNLLAGAIDVLIRGQASSFDLNAAGDKDNAADKDTNNASGSTDPPASSKTDTGQSDTTKPDASKSDASGSSPPASPGDATANGENRIGRRTAALREMLARMPTDRYVIEYVPHDRHSEWALQYLRSMFALINEDASKQLMRVAGAELHPRVTMSASPIKLPNDSPSTLASLVPLVLVLMTIAGAVYPAIDLTAGERERGTLEAMIVSPTPRSLLLLAKYVAVVTVALLTALANLAAMSITLWASGLGRLVFGEAGLSLVTVFQILCLLVLFAMFFSAVLLSITSFAKSFKEAQAYLIPIMLVSLAPGVLSLLPQVRLTNILAVVPLANIVLLSRDVLVGSASSEAGVLSIICTMVYAVAAIAVASRLFGSDASLQGSQGSWRDLVRRPDYTTGLPTVDQMALTMAIMFPMYFVASTTLPMIGGGLFFQLLLSALISWALIFGLPTIVSYYRRHDFRSTYLLSPGRPLNWLLGVPAVLLMGFSLWMVSHELMMFSKDAGIATFTEEQLKRAQAFADRMPELPLALLLFSGAITPAICEEWFFRGFVMSSLRRFGASTAIVGSAFLFALMHVLTSNMLSMERMLPSFFMGIVLGFLAWRTQTLWLGIVLHALHNGFLLSLGHFKEQLDQWDITLEENAHLPLSWLLAGLLASAVGIGLIMTIRRR